VRELLVAMGGEPAGRLEEDAEGRLSFAYLPDHLSRPDAASLSHTLPLASEPVCEGAARTFFAGLLPEGPVREHAAAALGIAVDDDVGLLGALGPECAGAVRLLPPQDCGTAGRERCRWLSEAELASCLRNLPRRPLGIDEAEGARVCLAGAQDKLPVVLDRGGRVGLSLRGHPTTHVLKVQVDGFEDTQVNEAFCLALAGRLGLPVVEAALRRAEDVTYLAVRRYDRRPGPDGAIVRVHQEDLCQALALPPTRKYQADGGPTLIDCLDLIRAASRHPERDVETLVRAVALDYLIGNNDAHGKNFSLVRNPARGVGLAPLYDLGCTELYPGLPRSLAIRVDAEESAEELRPRDWRALAERAGISPTVLERWARPLAARAPGEARVLASEFRAAGWGASIPNRLSAFVGRRASALERTLADLVGRPPGGARRRA
jgi:serine/threonine-protein kinase HipA